ncbi:heme/hemin ABC transporter substrate-binding protein [Skermania piniformis]|uniref:ABC transporter substrate-binding protein n=1 Tax=Skermania pinensis TaxID=39122 RepID=A0ABX8SAY3_9ACTN|nr:ABC transporter substrate-binding protein [Skermania piniformis]QXQ15025.1 ABC transporter substrate-binding protein [Skermania piniformis]
MSPARTVSKIVLVICALLGASTVACSATGSGSTGAEPTGAGAVTAVLPSDDPPPISTDPQPTLPVTVRSADGSDVTVRDVSRIVAIDRYGTFGTTVFALGLGRNLIGRDIATSFPAAEHIPVVTSGGNQVNAESVLQLRPTVVLTDSSIEPATAFEQIEGAGVPVVSFDPTRSIDNAATQIRAVAAALGVPPLGTALADRTAAEIRQGAAMVPADRTPPKIAFLYARGTGLVILGGPGSGADTLIRELGGVDAGTAAGLTAAFTPVTTESLITAAPDVLLMMTGGLASLGGVEGLERVPGIAQTPAGQNRRVVDMDDGVLLSFGPRTGAVLIALARALYQLP